MVAFDAKCDLGAFGMVMDYREHVTSNVYFLTMLLLNIVMNEIQIYVERRNNAAFRIGK